MWWANDQKSSGSTLTGHWAQVYCVAAAPRSAQPKQSAKDESFFTSVFDEEGDEEDEEDEDEPRKQPRRAAEEADWFEVRNVASGDACGRVLLWKAVSGGSEASGDDLVRTLCGHGAPVRGVAWDPAGARLASVSDDGRVLVWNVAGVDAATYGISRVLRGHLGGVSSVTWSKAGNRLASAGQDAKVVIWNVTGDEPKKYHRMVVLSGHTGSIDSLSWSPDGVRIASGGKDELLRLWRVKGGDPTKYRQIAAMDGTQSFKLQYDLEWTFAMNDRLRELGITTHAEKQCVRVTTVNDEVVRMFASKELLMPPESEFPLRFEVIRQDKGSGGHRDAISAISWEPSSDRIASADEEGEVIIWSVEGKVTESYFLQVKLNMHKGEVMALAWNPNGKHLASAGVDKRVLLWHVHGADPRQYHVMRELSGAHTDTVNSLAWSPDIDWLVSVSDDNQALLWSLIAGIPMKHRQLGGMVLGLENRSPNKSISNKMDITNKKEKNKQLKSRLSSNSRLKRAVQGEAERRGFAPEALD